MKWRCCATEWVVAMRKCMHVKTVGLNERCDVVSQEMVTPFCASNFGMSLSNSPKIAS